MKKRTALAMLAVLGAAACADESTSPTGPEMGVFVGPNANISAQASSTLPGDSARNADSAGGESRGAYIGAGF